MLSIKLRPIRADNTNLTASWKDPVLTVYGKEYDLSELPDGATAFHGVLGNVGRVGNDYGVSLLLAHGGNAPYSTRFPESLLIENDGEITFPVYDEVV